jgi:hypothetical protein
MASSDVQNALSLFPSILVHAGSCYSIGADKFAAPLASLIMPAASEEQRLAQWQGEQRKAAAHVCMAIESLASNLGFRHVLSIRSGTRPYLRLWHDGLDGIFDFKSAWVQRRREEVRREEEAARRLAEEARRKARRRGHLGEDSDDADEMSEVPDANTHGEGQAAVHGLGNVGSQQALSDRSSCRVTARCAMKSWQFFAMGVKRRLLEASVTRAKPAPNAARTLAPTQPVDKPAVAKMDRDQQDLERAYGKVDAFCKQRIRSARRPKGSDQEGNGRFTADTSRWSEATLEETLDLLRCAELMLEDTITNDMLADLFSHDPSESESVLRSAKVAPGKESSSKKKNLFLESDYRDEVEWRELAARNALEVIITLHQHVLWKLPLVTKKTSQHLAEKHEQKRIDGSIRFELATSINVPD